MDMSASTIGEDLLGRLEDIEPLIRRHAREFDENRKVSENIVEALRDAGFFKLYTPRAYGGLEIDMPTAYRIFEKLADIDSAVGWTVPNANLPMAAGSALPEPTAEEIFANPKTIMAGSPFPPGKAIRVDGGYQVSARIGYCSGCDFATFIAGSALVYDEDGNAEVTEDGKPVHIRTIFRAEDVEITGNWHTLGMRGTGSHDVIAADVFVPEGFTHPLMGSSYRNPAFDGALYTSGAVGGAIFVAVVCLGSANQALTSAIELALEKTPVMMSSTLGDRPVAQAQLAEAKGKIDGARAYITHAIDAGWQNGLGGNPPTVEHKVSTQIAGCHGVRAASEAMDLIFRTVGSSTIHLKNPFERHMRDIQTLTTHAFTSTLRYESAGKLMLGREPDWPFLR